VARLKQGPLGILLLALVLSLVGTPAGAQQEEESSGASRFGKLLLGGGAGFVLHETGHLIANWAFEQKVVVRKIDFQGIPFFALTHTRQLSPRREYIISAAGFFSQYLYSEQILTHHPHIKNESSPFRKGMLTFHVVTSLIYSGAAIGKIGPMERDTRGMAASRNMDEKWIGVMILVPALLDTYRVFHPDARWAAWASRGAKISVGALVIK
jgi:hypothetical protein